MLGLRNVAVEVAAVLGQGAPERGVEKHEACFTGLKWLTRRGWECLAIEGEVWEEN